MTSVSSSVLCYFFVWITHLLLRTGYSVSHYWCVRVKCDLSSHNVSFMKVFLCLVHNVILVDFSLWWVCSVLFLSLLVSFISKFLLADIKMATRSCFLDLLALNMFAHPFTLMYVCVFLGCSRRFSHLLSLGCAFSLGNWDHWCWERWTSRVCWFYYFDVVAYGFSPSSFDLLIWYNLFLVLSWACLASSGWSFPPSTLLWGCVCR